MYTKKEEVPWAIYSGTCLCGHPWDEHHGNFIMNEDIAKLLPGQIIGPGECEFFGCNEDGGLDENRQNHCWAYIDKDHPDEAIKQSWKGTVR